MVKKGMLKVSTYRCMILFFLVIIRGCTNTEASKVTIATSANMQFAIQEISNKFSKQTGIDTQLIIGSSGKLTAQIKEGAPYDIFVAANMKYPNSLYKNKLTSESPKIYGQGQLVLWTCYNDIPLSIEQLTSSKIKYIAIANPKTAPYGEAAIHILKHYSLYDTLKHKLVYGESIAQTNQFITSKSASIGFTAQSVVLSPKMKNKGHWMAIDTNAYRPINQGVVMIKQASGNRMQAQKFYDFLFSKEAQETLKDFGYLIPD